jgi:hypothetical protein
MQSPSARADQTGTSLSCPGHGILLNAADGQRATCEGVLKVKTAG